MVFYTSDHKGNNLKTHRLSSRNVKDGRGDKLLSSQGKISKSYGLVLPFAVKVVALNTLKTFVGKLGNSIFFSPAFSFSACGL